MTPDEQLSEANEGKGDGGVCSNTAVEVNCNGLTATSTQQSNMEAPEKENSAEAAVEEEKQQQQQLQEDQQNANEPDSSLDTTEAQSVDTEHQNCNGSAQDSHLQAPPTAVSPDCVSVEIKEEEAEAEAKAADEQMLYGGDAKREDKDKGNQDNFLFWETIVTTSGETVFTF